MPTAVVTSPANTSLRSPAAAFPSSLSASISSSCRAEALGLDPRRLVSEAHERLGDGLDERGRSAHERQREIVGSDLREQLAIDPPAETRPARRLLTREGEHDLQAVRSFAVSLELIAIDDVLPRPCRVEQLRRHLVVVRGALTHHGHEGNDAGAAADEEHGPAGIWIPDEVTADGTAQLEPVS